MKWVNGLYYLFAGLWFGAMVMLAVSAAVTFKTVRAQMPDAAPAVQNLFAGNIVGNVVNALAVIQIICAVAIVLCAALQWRHAASGWANYLRMALLAISIGLLALDRLHVNPTIWKSRTVMLDETADPQARQAAKADFDHHHKVAENLGGATTFLLAGAILISPLALHRKTGLSPDANPAG